MTHQAAAGWQRLQKRKSTQVLIVSQFLQLINYSPTVSYQLVGEIVRASISQSVIREVMRGS